MDKVNLKTLLPACPFLPAADPSLSAVSIRAAGKDRSEAFYQLALTCAQALWQKGLPAQAILMINRAFSADLSAASSTSREWHPPYRALRWILEHRRGDQFLGNPRRHFQHLATRMSGPRSEIRSWRAWACWAIACSVNPDDPADDRQIAEEGIIEPDRDTIREHLATFGWQDEADFWMGVLTGD